MFFPLSKLFKIKIHTCGVYRLNIFVLPILLSIQIQELHYILKRKIINAECSLNYYVVNVLSNGSGSWATAGVLGLSLQYQQGFNSLEGGG